MSSTSSPITTCSKLATSATVAYTSALPTTLTFPSFPVQEPSRPVDLTPSGAASPYQTQDLSNHYDSLQSKFEHRFNRGYSALVAYTYLEGPAVQPVLRARRETRPTSTHSLRTTFHTTSPSAAVTSLPFGHGRTHLNKTNGFVDAVVGGWQAQTILVVRSGTPYTPIISSDRANTGVGSQRPNVNPAGGNPNFQKSLAAWFDRTRYVVARYLHVRPGSCQHLARRVLQTI